MANENETVEQVHDELKRDPLAPNGAKPWTHYLAERIIAAHKRELAEQADVNEAQATQLRDALNECEELKHEIAAKDGGIKYLRALVKELADALDKRVCRIKDCRTECGAGMGACMDIDHRELVDKAREVLNG